MNGGKRATITIDQDAVIGAIGENLFGSFLEHVGRAIYTGIYEPDHPLADGDGFRTDVLAMVRELGVPIVRYPGGNFVSGYRWQDGIGPKAARPRRPERAWRAIETNQVGIDDFAGWADKAGCGVMPAVNMGTGTPQDAADLVEYCNFAGGTYWADRRRENGRAEPYGFKIWCVGNEMDGPWQIGHLNAEDYGKKALEAIKLMKWTDPSIQTVVAGSSAPTMPTYPEWDRVVLEHTYEHADFISLHRYYGYNPETDNLGDYLHSWLDMDAFIKTVAATADYVKALKRSRRTMLLSFDEWNIWHQHRPSDSAHEWAEVRPILEDRYDLADALAFSGLMMTLINNAGRVRLGCLAQLVNVIAPIVTRPGGGTLRQTIWYPYRAVCRYAKGAALSCTVRGERRETAHGDAPPVCAAAAYREDAGELTVFLLNPSPEAVAARLDLRQFESLTCAGHEVLSGDLGDANTFDEPDKVSMKPAAELDSEGILGIGGYSFHVIRYRMS